MIFYDNIPEFLAVARMLGLEPYPTVHYMRVPLETRRVCNALKLLELRKIIPEANNPLHEPLPASPLIETGGRSILLGKHLLSSLDIANQSTFNAMCGGI